MLESDPDVVGLTLNKVDIPNEPRGKENIEFSVVVTCGPDLEFLGWQFDTVEYLLG